MKRMTMFSAIPLLAALALSAGPARAAEWTLLVAPARHSVLQVAFDVARTRPTVLVSYQGDASEPEPALHAWNGEEWIGISRRDLAEVRFMQVIPIRVVLLGDETVLPPAVAEATAWCARIVTIPELDTPSLINAFGTLFAFSRDEWQWFASRYKLDVADRNEPLRSGTWYERPTPLPRRARLPFFRRRSPESAAVEPPPSPIQAPPAPVELVPAMPANESAFDAGIAIEEADPAMDEPPAPDPALDDADAESDAAPEPEVPPEPAADESEAAPAPETEPIPAGIK